MSIKGKGVDVNDMEVSNEDPSLRISMANLSWRDDFQSGDHVSRHHPDLMTSVKLAMHGPCMASHAWLIHDS